LKGALLAAAALALMLALGTERLHGMGFRISGAELALQYSLEYNRAFLFCWDVSAMGALWLNGRHALRGGIAPGSVGGAFEIKWFAGGETAPFARFPMRFSLDYKHSGLPEFEYRSHSLRLLAGFSRERWGISMGPTFRFSRFFGELGAFEPILSFSIHAFFVDNRFLRLGMRIANFNEFATRTMAAHFLSVSALVRLSKRLALVNELEAHQSGSFALAANIYGVVYRGGLVFLW